MDKLEIATDTAELFLQPETPTSEQTAKGEARRVIASNEFIPVIDLVFGEDEIWQYSAHKMEPPGLQSTFVTAGYLSALKNRLIYSQILPGGVLSMRAYPAVFLHDIAMLPGSLAHTIRKASETDIIDRLTPAILPGYKTIIDPYTKESRAVKTNEITDYIRGIVVFGQGKNQRKLLDDHFQHPTVTRRKDEAIIEVSVPQPRATRQSNKRWRLERTIIHVDVWRWFGHSIEDVSHWRSWKLDEYISGQYFDTV